MIKNGAEDAGYKSGLFIFEIILLWFFRELLSNKLAIKIQQSTAMDAPQRYPVRRREGRAVVLPGELAANRAGQVSLFGNDCI